MILSKINLIMRTLLIMSAVLLYFNFTACFPYSAKYVNENYDTASIVIRYKQPVTIARYENPRITLMNLDKDWMDYVYDYVYGYYKPEYARALVYDTVYIDKQPENFKFEYAFQEPKIDIDDDGNLHFEIDTAGTFSCKGNQAIIKIFPYKELGMYYFVWFSEDDHTNEALCADNAAYADILESVTIRGGLTDTTYVKYYDLMYDAIDKLKQGIRFKSLSPPTNHSKVRP